MRKFRSNTDNFRDVRLLRTLLISFVLLCAVTGTVLVHFRDEAVRAGLENERRTLAQCADALNAWERAKDDSERISAALRFENAVTALPSEVRLEPFFALSRSMRSGGAESAYIRRVADVFAALSATEFVGKAQADAAIAENLNRISGDDDSVTHESVTGPPPEVLVYTKRVVCGAVKGIFNGNGGSLTPVLSDDGTAWVVLADNVRMIFDANSGKLDDFVFLRLGVAPHGSLSEGELIAAAENFYRTYRRCGEVLDAVASDEICGFTAVDVNDGGELWRVCIDSHGRVWRFFKVKR